MHCISLTILSRQSQLPSPAINTTLPFCVKHPINKNLTPKMKLSYSIVQGMTLSCIHTVFYMFIVTSGLFVMVCHEAAIQRFYILRCILYTNLDHI